MNRWQIYDSHEERYMHIRYDTRASVRNACRRLNNALWWRKDHDPKRYRVVDRKQLKAAAVLRSEVER